MGIKLMEVVISGVARLANQCLNRNLPYNQFTVEQLAGDLLLMLTDKK